MKLSPWQGRLAAVLLVIFVFIIAEIGVLLFFRQAPAQELGAATETPTATVGSAELMLTREALYPATPTPTFVVVIGQPTPRDVFEAATRVVQATEDARRFGTATPTPPSLVTATFTPERLVVANTPSPANASTAEFQARMATAIAVTTGTFTPVPLSAVTATDTPAAPPTPTATRTPTFVVVAPGPQNAFEAATRAVQATADARQFGTATPTPPYLVTATFTPGLVVVTPTATPANASTVEFQVRLATAVAVTTGTYTPVPVWVVTATATPTATPTPVMIALEDLPRVPTPSPASTPRVPSALVGKILFLSNMSGKAEVYAINPDGTGAALVTSQWPYDLAEERDAYSADRVYRALVQQEIAGSKLLQIFMYDSQFDVALQMTAFGAGTAWAPVWSPTDNVVAFVSSETGNDEIWVLRKDEWPAQQLTKNVWEWDHNPSWSPDGARIVFSSNRGGKNQLWLMNADGSNQRPLTDFAYEAWDPVWVKYAN